MRLIIHHVFSPNPNTVNVQWGFEEPDTSKLSGVLFDVEVSGSPEGEWEVLATDVDAVLYVDELSGDRNSLKLSREMWYRITARFADGTCMQSTPVDMFNTRATRYEHVDGFGLTPREDHTTPNADNLFTAYPTKIQRRLQLVQRVVQRRAAINLQLFSGVEAVLLKRKRFGTRCPACWDPVTQAAMNSKCGTCYGTGFERGYWDPIVTNVRISEAPERTSTQLEGDSSRIESQIELTEFPRVEKDDILVELDSNRRWRFVAPTRFTGLRRRETTQHWVCVELGKTAAAYCFEIDYASLRRQEIKCL